MLRQVKSAPTPFHRHRSIVGMLTEHDLLIRLKKRPVSWWWVVFTDGAELGHEYQRAVGTKVSGVMRPTPALVDPETTLE